VNQVITKIALEAERPSEVEGVSQGAILCKATPMKKCLVLLIALSATALPVLAESPPVIPLPAPSPGEIVNMAKPEEWVAIAATGLLVMDLAADAKGKPRRVVIQLMPPPFSQGWIGNIRKLAAAHWWDGTSVNRVQDNYVVQWGDVTEKKALPVGLVTVGEEEYVVDNLFGETGYIMRDKHPPLNLDQRDPYGRTEFLRGWPIAWPGERSSGWPIHCYAMVGVGRNLSPDTGSGAELYTVIGHAPRHLDRNIALVGRVIEGIEHLSSLPRGTGALGFYETAEERVPIRSVRIGSEMETDKPLPRYEYLSTESESFAKYADARANRRDPFFIKPAGGADICNIPVTVRRVK
jgi:cyclophilin family peptidyl-prolyl cis-trans isomerase